MRHLALAPALFASLILTGCCTCLSGPDESFVPEPEPEPAPQSHTPPPPEPVGAPEECPWFYEVAYDDCTAPLPDAPVEPCFDEEGSICDGRLNGARPIQAVLGSDFGCALFDTGRVKCWGSNGLGKLGLGHDQARGRTLGEQGDALRYVDLGDGQRAVEISAGASGVCALLESGRVKCWGSNLHGQLGLGDDRHRGDHRGEMGDRLPHVDLGHQRAVHISAGSAHVCALMGDGSVRCWGENLWGLLGVGIRYGDVGDDPGEMGAHLPAVDLGPDCAPIRSLHAGGRGTCALFEDGRVKCWGDNTFGELGLGHDEYVGADAAEMGAALPYVDLGGPVYALSVGKRHACAVLDGGVKCWGEGHGGLLGQPMGSSDGLGDAPGEMGDALPFVDLGRPDPPVQVISGFDYNCALFADGWVKCWGQTPVDRSGHFFALGDEPGEMGEALPYVPFERPIIELVEGQQGICGWTDLGTLRCFGRVGLDWPDDASDHDPLPALDFGR